MKRYLTSLVIRQMQTKATSKDHHIPIRMTSYFLFFKKDFMYLFLEKGREGERETLMCGCLSCAPYWGPGWQPRHVP